MQILFCFKERPLYHLASKNYIHQFDIYFCLFLFSGSIMDASVQILLDRLRGLCDGADTQPEMFQDHEVVFVLKDFTGSYKFHNDILLY